MGLLKMRRWTVDTKKGRRKRGYRAVGSHYGEVEGEVGRCGRGHGRGSRNIDDGEQDMRGSEEAG
jgi:hypothetical protein